MREPVRFMLKYPEVLQAALKIAVCALEYKCRIPKGTLSNYDRKDKA